MKKSEATELKEYIYTIKQSIEISIYIIGFVIVFIMLMTSTLKTLGSVDSFIGHTTLLICVIIFFVFGLVGLIVAEKIWSNINEKLKVNKSD